MKSIIQKLYLIALFQMGYTLCNQNIFIIAPPKTGNHLVAKTIRLLTNKKPLHSEIAPTGTHWTHIDPEVIAKTGPHIYLCSHAFALSENIAAVKETDCKVIFVNRDPRDQLISLAQFMKWQDSWPNAKKLPWNTLVMNLIHDYSMLYISDLHAGWGHPIVLTLKNIDDFYNRYLGWIDQPFVYTTTFERLVGEKGGGNREVQTQEIIHLAQHIGVHISPKKAERIGDKLFGSTATFKKGSIGQWKKHLNDEHKKAFKKIAGQLLIDLGYEKDFDW